MKKKSDEEKVNVTLLGFNGARNRIIVAYSNATDRSIAHNANFTFADNGSVDERTVEGALLPTRIVSVWNSSNATVISLWILSEKDGIYRSEIDVDINSQFAFQISRVTKGGTYRQVNLSIDVN